VNGDVKGRLTIRVQPEMARVRSFVFAFRGAQAILPPSTNVSSPEVVLLFSVIALEPIGVRPIALHERLVMRGR
jgi:hypothetical protein